MTKPESHTRRRFLSSGLAAGSLALCGLLSPARAAIDATSLGLMPDSKEDQSAVLQRAIDEAALSNKQLYLPAGRYRVSSIALKLGLVLSGMPGKTVLEHAGRNSFFIGTEISGLRLTGLVFDGLQKPLETGPGGKALVSLSGVRDLVISDCRFLNSPANGLGLRRSSGAVKECQFSGIGKAALFSEDAVGLDISHNRISDCANNGILVWRSKAGDDGTLVAHNRISKIRAEDGGSGQNGNGVNIFRAANVLIQGNRISDCAFTAVRANSTSNCQIIANRCSRIGEVALYAEFAFEGAIIANNLVDGAAMGISVTNFMPEGGRLAVVQGNIVRNIATRRDGSRGIGIGVEADTTITGNIVENAASSGIQAGYGAATRDVQISSNVVRSSPIGIGASAHPKAGRVLITDNIISKASKGAIRAMDFGRAIGPDLARESAESYPNLSVFGNVTN